MSAKQAAAVVAARKVCLYAEISFDGKLLDPVPEDHSRLPDSLVPVWWQRLLARKRTIRADPANVHVLLETGTFTELCLCVRPCIDGRQDSPTLSGPGGPDTPFFARSLTWDLTRMSVTPDGGCLLHYRRIDANAAAGQND